MPDAIPFPRPKPVRLERRRIINDTSIRSIKPPTAGTVDYTTVASWIDWHVAMARRPYDTRQGIERFRVYADVGVSMLYAYCFSRSPRWTPKTGN